MFMNEASIYEHTKKTIAINGYGFERTKTKKCNNHKNQVASSS
jgi:hypothetical protein